MKLAIEGHSTQGSEVIARLKMLGGMNTFNLNGSETNCYYYINDNNKIYHCLGIDPRNYIYYTLEEFLEKFPYKVGDTVLYKPDNTPYFIIKMFWKNDKVLYELSDKINLEACSTSYTIIPDVDIVKLQPYKEETMEEKDKAMAPNLVGEDYSGKRFGYKIPQGYEFDCIQNNEIIIKPIKPQYPKTYEECCDILDIYPIYNKPNLCICEWHQETREMHEHYSKLANLSQKDIAFMILRICRDAYWKIAGEEMGLDKPWEPDWKDASYKYFICYIKDEIWISNTRDCNRFLGFPTKEMRDAFYENFKDLIEQCKELL